MRTRLPWSLLATLVAAQICYPLTDGRTRATLTVTTVLLGYAMSVTHAFLTRGPRAATALVAAATVRSAPAMVLADVSPAGPPAMTTTTGVGRPPAHSDLRPPASSAGGREPGPHQGGRPGRGRLS